MLHLLLLHFVVLPPLLVYCCNDHDKNAPTPKAERGEKNEGLKKDENKKIERDYKNKKEEQTDQKNIKTEDDKGVVHDEKNYQKKEEEHKARSENDKGEIKVKQGGNTEIYPPDPDYRKLATEGMTEAEIKANDESYDRWCAMERAGFEGRYEGMQKKEERVKKRRKGEIVESVTQNSYNDEEDKKEESRKEKCNKSKCKKSKTDRTQNSEKA